MQIGELEIENQDIEWVRQEVTEKLLVIFQENKKALDCLLENWPQFRGAFLKVRVSDLPAIETIDELETPFFKGAPAKFEIVG